jgi:hypothetical protein
MKQIFLVWMLVAGIAAQAQSLSTTNEQYVFSTGTGVGEQYIKGSCDVRNLTNNTLDVNTTVSALTLVSGHQFRYCWGVCLNWGAETGSDPIQIPPASSASFYAEVDTNGLGGVTTIQMRFFRTDNANDTASRLFTFDAATLSAPEVGPDRFFAAYPNPANEALTLELPTEWAGQQVTAQVITPTGQVASVQVVRGNTLSTEGLANGSYVVLLRANGALQGYTRIQVQH